MSATLAPPAARRRRASAGALVGRLEVLWRFARPHTIIGTTTSVLCLYVIARGTGYPVSAFSLGATMLAAWLVNLAIVGINQVTDVEIDRINKPGLPLASGELGAGTALALVLGAAGLALAMAATQGAIELIAVGSALLIGFAYSLPPARLKRFPIVAMASISVVRAFAVNLGVFGHFAGTLDGLPAVVWALTAFTIPFGAAIAVLKDVPDVAGDRAFRIRTFSVRLGPRKTFRGAVAGLATAYLAMAVAAIPLAGEVNAPLFCAGHLALLAALLSWSRDADPMHADAFTPFYMRLWGLFFCEYIVVAASVVL